jgi:hypothetical protein
MRGLTTPSPTPARFSATTVIACVALLVSGCAMGLLLGRWTSGPTTPDHSLPEAQAQPQDLKPILEDIRRGIGTLAQVMRDSPARSEALAASREPAAANPEALDRLTAAVEKLNGLLERGAIAAGANRVSSDIPKGSGYPSLSALWQKIDSIHSPDDPDWQSKAETEVTRAHLMWTIEELVARYGASSSISTSGSLLSFVFQRPMEAERANSVIFRTGNGVFIGAVLR